MTRHAVLQRYVEFCRNTFARDERAQAFLTRQGITAEFVSETFQLGYADGRLPEIVEPQEDLKAALAEAGILRDAKEIFRHLPPNVARGARDHIHRDPPYFPRQLPAWRWTGKIRSCVIPGKIRQAAATSLHVACRALLPLSHIPAG